MTKITKPATTRGGSRPGAGWKRPANQIKVGRHILKAGEQVLTRSTFPDGTLTMGKVGVLEIEQGIRDGDFTILVRYEDGEKFLIGVYRE